MPQSTNERDALTSRALPHMTLSTGDPSSMTGPPTPMPHYLSAEGRAVKRFAVEGNAIRMSTNSRVQLPAISSYLALHWTDPPAFQ